MKTIITLLAALAFSTGAFAAQTKGGCSGNVGRNKIVFRGYMNAFPSVKSGAGELFVNGRSVSKFDGQDARVNYLTQTFKASNNHGHSLVAKVTNLNQKTGVLKSLVIREHGINLRNVPISCWLN